MTFSGPAWLILPVLPRIYFCSSQEWHCSRETISAPAYFFVPSSMNDQISGNEAALSLPEICARSILIFFIAYILIRLSGRRSFGLRTPLDNIIVILLGAILSRAVLGSSPFLHVIVAATTLSLLHRCCGRILLRYPALARIIEGEKILLYEKGEFLREKMNRTEVSQEDIMLAIRKTQQRESLDGILRIYIERNGSLTIIREEKTSLSGLVNKG